MKLICTFCIIAVCLCYGCEKKKNTAPAAVTTTTDTPKAVVTYPYTDTFYGVWSDSAYDQITLHDKDSSVATIFYALHTDSVTVNVKGEFITYQPSCVISGIATCFFGNYSFDLSFTYDSARRYFFDYSQKDIGSNISITFNTDSIYFRKTYDAVQLLELGSFSGKIHIH